MFQTSKAPSSNELSQIVYTGIHSFPPNYKQIGQHIARITNISDSSQATLTMISGGEARLDCDSGMYFLYVNDSFPGGTVHQMLPNGHTRVFTIPSEPDIKSLLKQKLYRLMHWSS